MNNPRFATLAIHAGQEDETAVIPPIHLSSTFKRRQIDQPGTFSYARANNPTRAAFETQVAALENADWGLAFASGVAAADAVARLFRPGERVVIGIGYGGTFELFRLLKDFGLEVEVRDLSEPKNWNFKGVDLLWLETPTNPWFKLIDLEKIIKEAQKTKALIVVDNTISSPYITKPLDLGADLVIHSATKYLGGHSDLIIGVVVGNNEQLGQELAQIQESFGAIPGPFECWLASRSIKTLELRMEKHCSNALELAKRLKENGSNVEILYPGLPDHPGHEIAKKQMRSPDGKPLFGGLISLIFDTPELAKEFCNNLKLFNKAESLGGVESLVGLPFLMSHSSLKNTPFAPSEAMVRLSIGIEDVEDLWNDLEQAFNFAGEPKEKAEVAIAFEDPAADMSDIELDRYARLRDWRNEEANNQGISRFIVASNAVLSELARAKPANQESLAQIKGIGHERLKKYGGAILNILKNCP